jgi:hypothetical protein
MTRQNNDFISRRTASQAWRRNQNTVAFEYQAKLGPVSHTIIIAMRIIKNSILLDPSKFK